MSSDAGLGTRANFDDLAEALILLLILNTLPDALRPLSSLPPFFLQFLFLNLDVLHLILVFHDQLLMVASPGTDEA